MTERDLTLSPLERDLLYKLREQHNTWPTVDRLAGDLFGAAASARERTRVQAALWPLSRHGYVVIWRELGRKHRYALTTNGEQLLFRLDQLTLA